jgi:hypothetical protein
MLGSFYFPDADQNRLQQRWRFVDMPVFSAPSKDNRRVTEQKIVKALY